MFFKKIKIILQIFLNKLGYKIVKKNNLEDSIPIEALTHEVNLIKKAKNYSMTDYKNLYLSAQAIKYISENNIDGDIVECGVWKGGHIIIFKSLCEKYELSKKIFAFDTFEGMTVSTEADLNYNEEKACDLLNKVVITKNDGDNIWCYASLDSVKNNITNSTGNIANINFIKGDVCETLKETSNLPEKISLLRLDTDFYESTKIELQTLYPLLQEGGLLIIDDYGHWKGAKKAVDEYFSKHYHFKHVINGTCRMIIKKNKL
jgi:O-methyltransferase